MTDSAYFADAGAFDQFLQSLKSSPRPRSQVFRLGRLFKIIKSTRGLRTLVNAFMGALPAMFNVGLLFFIMIFISAIVAMDLFGSLPQGIGIFPENNFETIGNSLLACLKLFTGDNW